METTQRFIHLSSLFVFEANEEIDQEKMDIIQQKSVEELNNLYKRIDLIVSQEEIQIASQLTEYQQE
ncbi:MAG: hypothetical protein EBU90_01655 [Proteobacteria bacterium]|nr:hypothetical protein [Pseudomonadota bacterium]